MILLIMMFLWHLLFSPSQAQSPKTPPEPQAQAIAPADPVEIRGIYALPAPPAPAEPNAFDQVIGAIMQVESGGDRYAVGDGGLAIGPYQIHRAYWVDARRLLGVDWPYDDARDPAKAIRAVRVYTRHYAAYYRRPWTPETIARIHNGGPRGWQKPATLPYWRKVEAAMERGQQGQ